MKESDISSSSLTVYGSYAMEDLNTAVQESVPISISGNRVMGAKETDYTPGLNIPEKMLKVKSFANLVIDGNEIINGTDDVVVLDKCDKLVVTNNKFIESPSYCTYIDPEQDPEEVTVKGTGKSYIKYTDCDRIIIENNIAFGYRESDESPFYVTNPVMNGENPAEYSASNKFDHA
jgi:hypothetical protein